MIGKNLTSIDRESHVYKKLPKYMLKPFCTFFFYYAFKNLEIIIILYSSFYPPIMHRLTLPYTILMNPIDRINFIKYKYITFAQV